MSESDDTPPPAQAGSGTHARCLHNAHVHEIETHLSSGEFFWLDLDDPTEDEIGALGAKLNLHPLTIDAALRFQRRPKLEEYPGYVFMVVHGVDPKAQAGEYLLREVHIIVSGAYVITIHREPIDALVDLRSSYDELLIRSEMFLVYKILDAITQTYFPVLDRIDDAIDSVEDEVLAEGNNDVLQKIFSMKRDLVAMRRVITPMRDVFAVSIERIERLPGLASDDQLYFRDLYNATVRVSDLVDSYRDLLSGATDMYLSMVANRQGEISKQLTLVATIFLPLSFLTGFFGQNFAYLTDHVINATWTFWVLGLGLEFLAVLALVYLFKRQHWFGS